MNRSEVRFNDYIVLTKLKINNSTMKFNTGNNYKCHLVLLASSRFGGTGTVSLACISSMCLVKHSVPLGLFSLSFRSCVYFFFPLISWCDGCLVLLKWGIQGGTWVNFCRVCAAGLSEPYPIIVYFLANYRPHLSHFLENVIFTIPT